MHHWRRLQPLCQLLVLTVWVDLAHSSSSISIGMPKFVRRNRNQGNEGIGIIEIVGGPGSSACRNVVAGGEFEPLTKLSCLNSPEISKLFVSCFVERLHLLQVHPSH